MYVLECVCVCVSSVLGLAITPKVKISVGTRLDVQNKVKNQPRALQNLKANAGKKKPASGGAGSSDDSSEDSRCVCVHWGVWVCKCACAC